MKRLAAFAALAVAAASLALMPSGASAAPAPSQPVPWGGQGTTEQCLITHADKSQGACVDFAATAMMTTDGRKVFGRGTASVVSWVVDADKIASIRIDRVTLATQHRTLAVSHSVDSRTHAQPLVADTSRVAWTKDCSVRYRVQINYSARMTDGTRRTGTFAGPWFDSAHPTCAGNSYGTPVFTGKCLVKNPNGTFGGCLDLSITAAISHDSSRLYARGSVALEEWVAGADAIKSIRVDRVELKTLPSGRTRRGGPVGDNRHPLTAEAQTATGQRWLHDAAGQVDCAASYQAELLYSARMTDGTLVRGSVATDPVKAPGC